MVTASGFRDQLAVVFHASPSLPSNDQVCFYFLNKVPYDFDVMSASSRDFNVQTPLPFIMKSKLVRLTTVLERSDVVYILEMKQIDLLSIEVCVILAELN